jgi:glucosylceramidase
MQNIKWIYSNEQAQWSEKEGKRGGGRPSLSPNGQSFQKMNGFGGCFNEAGYQALLTLHEGDQEALLKDLFEPGPGRTNLTHCRLPIGANDYSLDWYSLDEHKGDYAMEHFSLKRDEEMLIPYIQRAKRYNPALKLFASPWSPPAWMKDPPVYNWGKLIKTKENLTAYALYLARFVEEYQKSGISIGQIHVQNEPVANQKFPSCMWTGEELRDFIRDYLGPTFQKRKVPAEIWLGTINAPGCDYRRLIFDKFATEDYDYFANTVLMDEEALQYIAGVSYQWGGKIAIQRTFESWWPRVRLMQSENECGFGDNTWEYARYNFTMLKHYISNGAESYMYWNLMLPPLGRSTWGDPQNAMITIDPSTKKAVYNPDYYVMKHFSGIIPDGSVRLGTKGPWAADTVAFRLPEGGYAFIVFNPFKDIRRLTVDVEGETCSFDLEPQSINSICMGE